jgi:hypothetical protein
VVLGDSERGNVLLSCVVYAEDIALEKGYGYRFGGIDFVYENGEQIQLYLGNGA